MLMWVVLGYWLMPMLMLFFLGETCKMAFPKKFKKNPVLHPKNHIIKKVRNIWAIIAGIFLIIAIIAQIVAAR